MKRRAILSLPISPPPKSFKIFLYDGRRVRSLRLLGESSSEPSPESSSESIMPWPIFGSGLIYSRVVFKKLSRINVIYVHLIIII